MTQFTFDPAHSSIEFQVKHLMVSKVKGSFTQFNVELSGDLDDLSSLKGSASIDVKSIDTNQADRDNHLRTSDFFDADNYPEVKFEIKEVTKDKVTGDLTIKGVTNEETFDYDFGGVIKNPQNDTNVAGFTVSGKVDREKYGMSFNKTLETGGVLIGNDVKFEAALEFEVKN
ncbi:YceI family protein [Staphylococcus debuckii]|uniref:YceI family protein n=1 Tax=Staphylococcus debuckii TaxID=2044912 RepID=UPI000F4377A6|nr:YceI family protein [Staphylococcus debuckii]AYU56021.1 polyisoprenoid-binding protein [Staphylococcus debuckii]